MSQQHELERCPIWKHHTDAIVLVARKQRLGVEWPDLVVHDLNPMAETMFGCDRATVRGGPAERFAPSIQLSRKTPPRSARSPGSAVSPDNARSSGSVFRARKYDGTAFAATAEVVPLGPPNHFEMVIIRDVTDLLAWRDGLPDATTERLDHLQAREQAVEARRETLAQHLFAAGLALQQIDGTKRSDGDHQLEHAVAVLDEVMLELMSAL